VNHTRFPKEDHLPDWARRDNKVTKGDRVEVREEIKTHPVCSITFFFNRAPCEIKWKNVVEPDRPHMVIWRMRILFWIIVTTDTHSEYVMIVFFSAAALLHGRSSMIRYTTLPFVVYFRDWPTTWYSEIYKQHVGNSIVFVIPLMLRASLCLCDICRVCTIESTGKRDVTIPCRHGRI